MFGRSLPLFKLFGFEVRVDASWLIIAALIVWSLAAGFFPWEYPGLSRGAYFWMGAAGALGLFGSIVVHELFHSLVARKHDLPMKGITLFVFGGVAQMGGEPQSPKVEFLMAIAGPIASILIGFLFYFLKLAVEPTWPVAVVGVIAYLGWINWVLAAFNLIPAFPLDGGRVLRSALWHFKGDLRNATRIASLIGSGFGVLLIAFGVYQLLLGSLIAAVWYFMLGMFLRAASRESYQEVMIRSLLRGEPIRRFMHTNPITVPPDISLQELVDGYVYRYDYKMFPVVTDGDHLQGCVSASDVKEIPREEWPHHRVGEVVKPCSIANTVDADADAMNALAKMRENGVSRLMVTDRDRLLAVVSLRDLRHFLAAKLELERMQPGSLRPSHP
jgi:Zn-dependent protease/predicted transcriptional regulator